MNRLHITIGTRKSDLAVAQTAIVCRLLSEANDSIEITIKYIQTEGDRNSSPIPLDEIGKGWFTKEIERELQTGNIDLAVHSLKDLPESLAEGLVIGAITEREDARDVYISKDNHSLEKLQPGGVVGTDSLRRQVQILAIRPDVRVESMRGNVPTRIRKLRDPYGDYDAVVLAAAGLLRLGLSGEITEYLESNVMTPAPGQGALAVESRVDDSRLKILLEKISHTPTSNAVEAERAFSRTVGGGCKKPVGAYAYHTDGKLILSGMIASDPQHIVRDSITGNTSEGAVLGEKLARRMLGHIHETS